MSGDGMSGSKIPRWLLLSFGALIVTTLLGVGGARLAGFKPGHDFAATVASRELRFADQDDGAILVTDGVTGQAVGRVAPGADGFIRATMRGLATERKHQGLDDTQPFLLSSRVDGALTLQDPATGRAFDLRAFGATNAGAFARFLPPAPSSNAKTAAL